MNQTIFQGSLHDILANAFGVPASAMRGKEPQPMSVETESTMYVLAVEKDGDVTLPRDGFVRLLRDLEEAKSSAAEKKPHDCIAGIVADYDKIAMELYTLLLAGQPVNGVTLGGLRERIEEARMHAKVHEIGG